MHLIELKCSEFDGATEFINMIGFRECFDFSEEMSFTSLSSLINGECVPINEPLSKCNETAGNWS